MKTIENLLDIMVQLRDPHAGCPWDREQTFQTIAPYTIEEAYEVADAIARGDLSDLKDELGDLLLQVVYHARMAEEAGAFDFDAVVTAICDKMTRRHPHVFGDETVGDETVDDETVDDETVGDETVDDETVGDSEALTHAWEIQKETERKEKSRAGVLADVPLALPALTRAAKLGRRAGRVGFDWPELAGPRAKVDEELSELDDAIGLGDEEAISAEMGDALFSLVNVCRHLSLDPEACLRGANARFSERFGRVEEKVDAAGGDWQAFDVDGLEKLWQQAKAEL